MVWLKKINKKLAGFTLVEAMVTLIIAISLVLLGTIQLATYNEKLLLDNTTREVKSSIEQAARISTIRHQPAVIRYYASINKLTIWGNGYSRTLNIDKHIKIYNLSTINLSANGSMPAHTVKITDQKNTKIIKLQMTWGRAIDDNS